MSLPFALTFDLCSLKTRILAMGYELADIDYIGMHAVPGSNVDKPLTDDGVSCSVPWLYLLTNPIAWKRIRAKVENTLSDAREARLRKVLSQRHIEAKQRYSDVLRQVIPVQRLCLPALSQVSELSCFRDFLDPDRDVDVEPAEWEHATEQLPQSLSEWMSEHRDRYISLLPPHAQGARVKAMTIRLLSDPSFDRWSHEAMVDFAGPLDLATSVFVEPNSNTILIGRDIFHAWGVTGLQFVSSQRGAEAVHALLQVLQLDPASTTVSTLGQLDRLFICASCPPDLAQNQHSWRSCVSRALPDLRNSSLGTRFRFRILSGLQKQTMHTLNGKW
jgi:hypothetical protein